MPLTGIRLQYRQSSRRTRIVQIEKVTECMFLRLRWLSPVVLPLFTNRRSGRRGDACQVTLRSSDCAAGIAHFCGTNSGMSRLRACALDVSDRRGAHQQQDLLRSSTENIGALRHAKRPGRI